jgi:hypothetical protein
MCRHGTRIVYQKKAYRRWVTDAAVFMSLGVDAARRTRMRTLFAALMLCLAASTIDTASAEVLYPWCAHYGGIGHGGGTNCGFTTFAQCQAAISGNGGYCGSNPFYASASDTTTAKRQHYYYR